MKNNSLPDPYLDYDRFLKLVAQWIQDHKMWKSTGLIGDIIWSDGQAVFSGVGVYTICELLFIAGKSY